jgi:NAD(P) transhydrogenase
VATFIALDLSPEVLVQAGIMTALGGGLGLAIGRRVSPMALPQTVAALHSVVGLAAVMTSVASVLGHEHGGEVLSGHAESGEHGGDSAGSGNLSTLHLTTAYLGVLIGGITFTGETFLNHS